MDVPIISEFPGAFRTSLEGVFGDRLQTGEAVRTQHGSSDFHFEPRMPAAVAFAETHDEVAATVRLCVEHEVPVIAFGAGTSVEGQCIPTRGGLSLDLSRMDHILSVNVDDLDCTVQAGVTREQLNVDLRDRGLFFPIDPGANATIGGMAATRASGTTAVRYGTMREAVLGLRAVMPDGREIRTSRRARKSAAGYDLTRLLIGSEGTLGIITEVTLRLHGIPEKISSAVCCFATLEGAINAVIQTIQLGVPIARIELLDDMQMRAVNQWAKLDYPELTTLFFEFHGSNIAVEEQIQTLCQLAQANGGGDFQWSTQPEQRSRLWKARHEAYYATMNQRPGAVGWASDVCVPISRLAECILRTKEDIDRSSIPATILGHVGDGNFHVIFPVDPHSTDELREVREINERLVSRALAMDGSCTGEHGIGLGKQEWLEAELGEAVDVMRQIKRTLDPKNLFNPGKIFALQ
jgi:D-lactate dehydrogenase (cytochrome)